MWKFNQDGSWAWDEHLLEEPFEDFTEYLKANQFERLDGFQGQVSSEDSIEVYRGQDDRYVVSINTTSAWYSVYCINLPAFLEFMRTHGAVWMKINESQAILETIEELRGLLIDEEHGVFRDYVSEVMQRKRAAIQRRKREMEARTRKATP